eukprot:1340449-Rhodomonas_salina.1
MFLPVSMLNLFPGAGRSALTRARIASLVEAVFLRAPLAVFFNQHPFSLHSFGREFWGFLLNELWNCLLYTSDAADDM